MSQPASLQINSAFYILEFICGDFCTEEFSTLVSTADKPPQRNCKCGNEIYTMDDMYKQSIYCCNTSPCFLNDTTNSIICNHGSMKKQDEKCLNKCPTGEFQSLSTISSADVCSKLEDDKCYLNIWYNEFKAVCHHGISDDDNTTILKFCGKTLENLKYEKNAAYMCPQIAKSKYSFQQCYSTAFASQER